MTNLRKIFLSFLLISALPAMSDTDHGDHLGSANWITDSKGDPVQYIHYAPFGELIANQRPCDYDERFKFTGKERDAESGYDFFGARYWSSIIGHWLSVDPLADKYPNFSPYAYCHWNHVGGVMSIVHQNDAYIKL
jgi:RHS repeat-associated protein